MRIFGVTVLVFLFGYMPFMMLDTLVMPELNRLQQTYTNAEAIAQSAVGN